jgi:hypothetical protein
VAQRLEHLGRIARSVATLDIDMHAVRVVIEQADTKWCHICADFLKVRTLWMWGDHTVADAWAMHGVE